MQSRRLALALLLVLAGSQPAVAEYAITVETIESGTLSQFSPIRLALDSASEPHLAYWANWSIRYAEKQNGTWTLETAIDDVGANLEFAVSPNGNAHLLYNGNQRPVYGRREANAWSSETLSVYAGEWVSLVSALELDAEDNPRVTYWAMDCGIDCDASLRYDAKVGGSWAGSSGVYGCLFNAGLGALALDASDGLHFFASCQYDPWAYYIMWDPWLYQRVFDVYTYAPVAFASDAEGSPHLVYVSNSQDGLWYWHGPSGAWTVESIDRTVSEPSMALALDGTGAPHVSYYDNNTRDLRYAKRAAGVWQYQVIDAGGDVGARSSIAVGNDGRVHIAYYDATNLAVKHAAIEFDPTSVPTTAPFLVLRAAPNPSSGSVGVCFRLDHEDDVRLIVYDVGGRHVRALAFGRVPAGIQNIAWDRLDSSGREVAPGTYFLRLTSASGQVTERVTIIR